MVFESFSQAQSVMLWSTFALALVLGAVASKTNFCTMGAVSDWVNMGDTGRMRAWLLAIAVAVLGVAVLEYLGLAKPGASFPPYRAGQFLWAEHLLGGLMFGVGMTLGSGCGTKTLVRIGGGNLKSVVVFGCIAVIAYFMVNPFPGSDQTLYTVLFYHWIRPLAANLGASQDLGAVIAGADAARGARLAIGGILGIGLLALIFRSEDFRGSFDNMLGGLVVGLVIVVAWYVTSNIGVRADGEVQTLQGYVQQWDFFNQSEQGKPADSRPLAPQSFTFINPYGQTLGYAASGFQATVLTFGVMSVAGVVLGSLLWALFSRGFRVEWFASGRDFVNHLAGGVLMGLGGVLAMGCTVGQAITGISTLAIGPFITFFGIVLGSALTMKVQYYKMVYEADATLFKAVVTALVDFRLLPSSLRKLEAV
ncbi:MAG TPA: YeeE/YedE family protein [Burkholderiales bacterium]